MPEQVDFATPAWLAMAREVFQQCVDAAGAGARERDYSICEVYEQAPEAIAPGGRAVWTLRLRDGRLDFSLTETDDVVLKIVSEFYAIHPIAAFVVGEDAERRREQNRRIGRAMKGGLVRVTGDPNLPAFLLPAHDAIARRTR